MSELPDYPPPLAPALPDSLWKRFCRWAIARSGWRLVGQLPNLSKVVVIGAPHSSNWDGVWGLLIKSGIGVDLGVMIKREALNGPFGPIVRRLGMVPIDRKAATDVVGQMIERFNSRERMWLGIAPEGTRKHVQHWKSGFLRIARGANVPIQPIFIDYPSKTFTLGPLFHPTDSVETDMIAIRAMFAPYRGKHRGA
ncbi:acyltransferase-like protein [Luteibacter rhizovicinus]|uniref:Acyltransferase-like protein n=1 Tax=Luteibacter rhizovicinus TaxID=242606 RepID=A0A4R3YUU7_9GAMM|nr:1-acyl-sn-glycerol-3-phosphate acyltransferase [Luteibacter rhizovicinus]TCV96252.1 acyltransferase-like protein [Luteibacter rhizovicinus]